MEVEGPGNRGQTTKPFITATTLRHISVSAVERQICLAPPLLPWGVERRKGSLRRHQLTHLETRLGQIARLNPSFTTTPVSPLYWGKEGLTRRSQVSGYAASPRQHILCHEAGGGRRLDKFKDNLGGLGRMGLRYFDNAQSAFLGLSLSIIGVRYFQVKAKNLVAKSYLL